MVRRNRHHEEELPFVALMDTMTNVVGVLIIVLVMIGIGLAKSVRKVLSDLPPVTIEEYEKLKKEVESTTPKDDPEKVDKELAKLETELKKVTETLETLDRTKDKQPFKIVDIGDLQKQLEERKKERDQKKAAVEKLLADIDALKQRLDTTPVYQPPPAMVVKLPNPRPMPERAEIHRFLVAGGRVLYMRELEFSELVEQELKRSEATLALSREVVKGGDGKPVMQRDKSGRLSPQRKVVYDPKKLTDHFARLRLGSREIRLEVTPSVNSPRIPVKLIPQPNSGETIDQAKRMVSVYQTQLKKMKADSKAVAWFYVFKDSIDTYLQARDIADQVGVPAGWELTGNSFLTRTMPPEYAVSFTPPPPPPANATPLIRIAPPKTTLD